MVSHVGHFSHHFIEQIQVSKYVKHEKKLTPAVKAIVKSHLFLLP